MGQGPAHRLQVRQTARITAPAATASSATSPSRSSLRPSRARQCLIRSLPGRLGTINATIASSAAPWITIYARRLNGTTSAPPAFGQTFGQARHIADNCVSAAVRSPSLKPGWSLAMSGGSVSRRRNRLTLASHFRGRFSLTSCNSSHRIAGTVNAPPAGLTAPLDGTQADDATAGQWGNAVYLRNAGIQGRSTVSSAGVRRVVALITGYCGGRTSVPARVSGLQWAGA